MTRPLVLLILILSVHQTMMIGQHIETLAGNGFNTSRDGPVEIASLANPFGVIRGPDGDIWFCEYDGHKVRKITQEGNIVTIVGTGQAGYDGDDGPALEAQLNRPHEIRFDRSGNLFIADMSNHAIRKVNASSGKITTMAGTGKAGFSGDGGLATDAQLKDPHSIQFGPDGDLYIADVGNHRIRHIDMQLGVITTFAGTGSTGATPDGVPFRKVPLLTPRTIDFDAEGNMWIALKKANQIFRLDLAKGTIHHMAGTGITGFSGNGGDARLATLSGPKGLSIAPNGDVFIADTESHTIRKIEGKTNKMVLVAGTGKPFDGHDGDPLKCGLIRPHGVFVDLDGSILIGDSENHKIRRLQLH